MTTSSDNKRLFLDHPLHDLSLLVSRARTLNARRLLLLAGKHPVCRIKEELSAPLIDQKLHFEQTRALAEALLSEEQLAKLDQDGAVEIPWTHDATEYTINVFYGDGSHNLIVFYE